MGSRAPGLDSPSCPARCPFAYPGAEGGGGRHCLPRAPRWAALPCSGRTPHSNDWSPGIAGEHQRASSAQRSGRGGHRGKGPSPRRLCRNSCMPREGPRPSTLVGCARGVGPPPLRSVALCPHFRSCILQPVVFRCELESGRLTARAAPRRQAPAGAL